MLRQFVAVAGVLAVLAVAVHAADLEGQVLKVGTDATYPPMETVDEATGEIVGFDIGHVERGVRAHQLRTAIREHGLGRHLRRPAAG